MNKKAQYAVLGVLAVFVFGVILYAGVPEAQQGVSVFTCDRTCNDPYTDEQLFLEV